ncbi:MAG: 4Fe-4S binding protein [Bryobacterales bacterium]|nr:4Fe-4S binding protein [Bryobacterales bacterium]
MATPSDLSSRPRQRLVRLPALPPAETNYHRIRKRIHLICVLIFVALPFFNLMRFDIPKQRFFFAGFELWINEFGIIFFSLMFLMFLIAASAIMHGRVYCSYACPQMIFSEWSLAVERWTARLVTRKVPAWPAARRQTAARLLFLGILGVASVFLAFVFTAYFVEPRDLLGRLLRLDVLTAGGITGAVVTLLTFLDFTVLRQRFCTTICPYGYLQGMLQDRHTLLVTYQDGKQDERVCIECTKCVRVCHMDIDIRDSPFQIECVHCGECIDACEDVLRRVGRPGLIHYTWGETPPAAGAAREPWYLRLGFRDSKRVMIAVILLFYLVGLGVALSMRRPVLVRVAPDRTVLYTVEEDGRVVNRIRMTLANRSAEPVTVTLWVENLPGAEIAFQPNPAPLAPGQEISETFDLRVPPWPGAPDVNRFRLLAQPSNEKTPDVFDLTFILPVEKKGQSQ